MARFDCNIDSPSCTLPANTGESAESGGGGGAHEVSTAAEWTALSATVQPGDTITFSGSDYYTIANKHGLNIIINNTGSIFLENLSACNIKETSASWSATKNVYCDGTFFQCTFNLNDITANGIQNISFHSCTINVLRVDFDSASINLTLYNGTSLVADRIENASSSSIINSSGNLTVGIVNPINRIENAGVLNIYNTNFTSNNLDVYEVGGVTLITTKTSGTVLKVIGNQEVTIP